MHIGLFGGSFDPIHHGHLIVAQAIAEVRGLSRILLLPSQRPPHKAEKRLADTQHRIQMIRLAISTDGAPASGSGGELFELSDFDATREGPTYTIDCVRHFQEKLGPQVTTHWIIGADSLCELPTWHRAAELVDLTSMLIAFRPGGTVDWKALERSFGADRTDRLRRGVVETPHIEISSTDIRRRVAAGLSIRYLVPESVAHYIDCHDLYKRDRPGAEWAADQNV